MAIRVAGEPLTPGKGGRPLIFHCGRLDGSNAITRGFNKPHGVALKLIYRDEHSPPHPKTKPKNYFEGIGANFGRLDGVESCTRDTPGSVE